MFNGRLGRTAPSPAQLLLAGALAAGTALLAAAPASAEGEVDERADRILRDMGRYLAARERFTFEARISLDRVFSTGEKVEYERRARVALWRPSRLRAEIDGDLGRENIWYDGERFSILNLDQSAWSTKAIAGNVGEALDLLAREYGMSSPLSDLVYADPYAVLSENVRSGRYVGTHRVGRVRTHHLAFRQETIDWQIWIEDGLRPVPRKFVITYRDVPGAPQYRAVLARWNVDPELDESAFRFEPPPRAVEADLFVPVN